MSSEMKAGVPDDDDRPWERPGAVRRDFEPHRGVILNALSVLSYALGLFGICLFIPSIFAVLFGILAYRWTRQDLAEMKAGRMDPAGRKSALTARATALAGIIAGAVGIVWFAAMPLLLWLLAAVGCK